MSLLRWLMIGSVMMAPASAVRAQSVHLAEGPLVDSCSRVKLSMTLKGKLTYQLNGKTEAVEHNAAAEHEFLERVLEAKGTTADKTARLYQRAEATIAGQVRTLRPERTFMVAHRLKDQLVAYSVKGPLTLEEMELTEHFDTLALPGLLPGKEVKIGDSWPIPSVVVQDLCGLDAVEKHDLSGTLTAVDGDLATITLQGTAKGIDLGGQVSTLISKSKLTFSAKEKRITALEWTQSDNRQQGPATPNLSADVTIQLERTPIDLPSDLNNFALAPVPAGLPPSALIQIEFRDPKGKYHLQHSRDWQFIGERSGQRVLRLITPRGDWVSDATLMSWSGGKLDAAKFKVLLDEAPGWMQDGEAKVDDNVKHPSGYTVIRVSASGKLEGVAAFRSSYHLTNGQGAQMIVTFVTAPNQVNALEARDQTLIEGIELK
jgi:hypothetical protein